MTERKNHKSQLKVVPFVETINSGALFVHLKTFINNSYFYFYPQTEILFN